MENNNLVLLYAKSKDVACDLAKKLDFNPLETVKYDELVANIVGAPGATKADCFKAMNEWFRRFNEVMPRKVFLWVEITDLEEKYFIDPKGHLEMLKRLSGVRGINNNPFMAAYSVVSHDHSVPSIASFIPNISLVVYDQRVHVLRANHNLNQEELHQKLNADLPAY